MFEKRATSTSVTNPKISRFASISLNEKNGIAAVFRQIRSGAYLRGF